MELTKHDVAVITGAGSGIGKATTIAMAQKGLDLALMDVNTDGLNATKAVAESHGVQALCEVLDVSDRQAVVDFADATMGTALWRAPCEGGTPLSVSFSSAGPGDGIAPPAPSVRRTPLGYVVVSRSKTTNANRRFALALARAKVGAANSRCLS